MDLASNGHLNSGWFLGGRRGDLVDDVVWEDATHLLVTRYDEHGWSLLRLTVAAASDPEGDGIEVVRGPLKIGTADSSPFNLPIR